ncbi:MAG: family 43 glycosylhydrolase [Clostridia bacterium]|nr:family 43 glycosylhydrolase [Clostridia bacterium]
MKKQIAKKNPILPGMGVCDPHIHVFDGRMYLYASHDAIPDARNFCMHDWQIWSSADAVEWALECTVRPEDFFMGPSDRCWAVDAAERNGKYYYYFSDGSSRIGVAVADRPGGPFADALGRPLLDGSVTTTREYDPAVFKDDDGEYYLVFGGPAWCYGAGCGYFIARLNEDMVSFAETPRKLELDHCGDDKASLNRIGGRYYLSYGGFYAVSDCVYGPYRFLGHTGSTIDHSSFCEWNGQLFQAITVKEQTEMYRSSGLCYVHVRENGELVTDPLIVEYGVGQYDSDWNQIEAEWFMRGEHVRKVENSCLFGFCVACTEKAVLAYPKIRNLADKVGFSIDYYCVGGRAEIDVAAGGEHGRLLGTIRAEHPTDSFEWYCRRSDFFRFDAPLEDVTDLCLILRPEQGATLWVDRFHFFPAPLGTEE